MSITCEVVKDLLPLYHDDICSQDSSKLVEEHLATCSKCKKELEKIDIEIKVLDNEKDVNVINNIAKKWKKDKLSAFLMGSFLLSVFACIGCMVSYNVIGSYVAADGTLIEPFGLIPLAYLFGFIAIILGCGLGFSSIRRHKKYSK